MEQHQFEFFEDEEDERQIDLIETQKQLLKHILNLGIQNSEAGDDEEGEIEVGDGQQVDKKLFTFKVFIFDQQVQSILAPVMKVGNLRECNVTLHLNLNSKRDPIPDIPAIYLVYEAKDEIIKRIAEDAMNSVYDYFFVNFCKQPSSEQISAFAMEMIRANAAHKICRVGFSHLNYQVVSQDLFVLPQGKNNFKALYQNNESAIEQSIEPIAQSLFSVFKSIGAIPYVRIVNNEISERVAKRLQALFSQSTDEIQQSPIKTQNRPLLIILDRNLDLHTMFYHSWNYLSLIQDIFGVKNNKFYFQEDSKSKPQEYDLDYGSDDFLKENMFKDFHEAAENVDKALNQWKSEYDQINKMAGGGQVGDISSNLTTAIDQLPQMTERKKKIDMHVSIASKILSEIKRRQIDKLQDIEDEIMTSKAMSNATKIEFMNFMKKETDSPEEFLDKMRLLLIFIFCSSDLNEIKGLIETLKALHHNEFEEATIQNILRKRKEFENQMEQTYEQQNQSSFIGGIAKQVTKGSKSLLSNISNILAEQKNLMHFNVVKKCIQNVQSKYITQNENYIDMKTGQKYQMVREQVKDVVVFVCGGGSYYEYQCMHNLQLEMKMQIVYGSDHLFKQQVMTPTTQGGTPFYKDIIMQNKTDQQCKKRSTANVYRSFMEIKKTKRNSESTTRKKLVNKLLKNKDSKQQKQCKLGSMSTKQSERTMSQKKTKESPLASEQKQNKSQRSLNVSFTDRSNTPLRNCSSDRKMIAKQKIEGIRSRIIMVNKTPVMSSRVDLSDNYQEMRELSIDKKNQKQSMQARNSINITLDSFSKQIDELTILRNELLTKVNVRKQDLKKVKVEIASQKGEVAKIQKKIIAEQNIQAKINGDCLDLYKQVENVAKSYVEKETSLQQILEKLQSKSAQTNVKIPLIKDEITQIKEEKKIKGGNYQSNIKEIEQYLLKVEASIPNMKDLVKAGQADRQDKIQNVHNKANELKAKTRKNEANVSGVDASIQRTNTKQPDRTDQSIVFLEKSESKSSDSSVTECADDEMSPMNISNSVNFENDENIQIQKPEIIPLVTSGRYSLCPDMKFGWKPTPLELSVPIPLYFDLEEDQLDLTPRDRITPKDSLLMHQEYLQHKSQQSLYPFKFPPKLPENVQRWLDQAQGRKTYIDDDGNEVDEDNGRDFIGMDIRKINQIQSGEILEFDAKFESGNLDKVVMVNPGEYDLFMRVDSNTKGHHQWFYFKVKSRQKKTVKFNIVNFTKKRSLYEQGMKVCICNMQEKNTLLKQLEKKRQDGLISEEEYQRIDKDMVGWKRSGDNIKYKLSKVNFSNNPDCQYESYDDEDESAELEGSVKKKKYYQVSFTYDFMSNDENETYFAYGFPYSFTKLHSFMKELKDYTPDTVNYLKESPPLCKDLSGIELPVLTVSSRVNINNVSQIVTNEFLDSETPTYQNKKVIVISARVHPGETNSSFMMQGFLKFITSNEIEALELRKKIIFQIIPMLNPDGVIIGNYRTSMSGNDLNRQYLNPHPKLHPSVISFKHFMRDVNGNDEKKGSSANQKDEKRNNVLAFIDLHGHSRKKNVFVYGNYYPIHHENYLKIRVLPKILSERTSMFRFFSSRFKIEKSKEKTARIVLWKEHNIVNCFTLEASFASYFNSKRETKEFLPETYERMGEQLGKSLFEFVMIKEEDERQREIKLFSTLKRKKRKRKLAFKFQSQTKFKEKQLLTPYTSSTDLTSNVDNPTIKKAKSLLKKKKRIVSRGGKKIGSNFNIDEQNKKEEQQDEGNPNQPPDESMINLNASMQPIKNGVRTIDQLYNEIKHKEQNKEKEQMEQDMESSSGGSDSDPSDGELCDQDRLKVQGNILSVLEHFYSAMTSGVPPQSESSSNAKQEQNDEGKYTLQQRGKSLSAMQNLQHIKEARKKQIININQNGFRQQPSKLVQKQEQLYQQSLLPEPVRNVFKKMNILQTYKHSTTLQQTSLSSNTSPLKSMMPNPMNYGKRSSGQPFQQQQQQQHQQQQQQVTNKRPDSGFYSHVTQRKINTSNYDKIPHGKQVMISQHHPQISKVDIANKPLLVPESDQNEFLSDRFIGEQNGQGEAKNERLKKTVSQYFEYKQEQQQQQHARKNTEVKRMLSQQNSSKKLGIQTLNLEADQIFKNDTKTLCIMRQHDFSYNMNVQQNKPQLNQVRPKSKEMKARIKTQQLGEVPQNHISHSNNQKRPQTSSDYRSERPYQLQNQNTQAIGQGMMGTRINSGFGRLKVQDLVSINSKMEISQLPSEQTQLYNVMSPPYNHGNSNLDNFIFQIQEKNKYNTIDMDVSPSKIQQSSQISMKFESDKYNAYPQSAIQSRSEMTSPHSAFPQPFNKNQQFQQFTNLVSAATKSNFDIFQEYQNIKKGYISKQQPADQLRIAPSQKISPSRPENKLLYKRQRNPSMRLQRPITAQVQSVNIIQMKNQLLTLLKDSQKRDRPHQ